MKAMRVLSFLIFVTGGIALAQQPASTPSTSDTKESKATVHIYRYKQFVGGALEPSVYCDEVQLARMDNGRYFAAMVDPGKHTFRSNDTQSGIELDAKAGQEYFIRVEIATGFAKGHGRLILMSPEQGSYELKSKKLKPLDASKVMDKARVSLEEVGTGARETASAAEPAHN
jgi:Protein of unknown function (DUF2846)